MAKISVKNLSHCNPLYLKNIEDLLERVLPENFLLKDPLDQRSFLYSQLPLIKWIDIDGSISIIVLSHQKKNIETFLYDLITRLLPDKRLSCNLFFTGYFQLFDLSERFMVSEIEVSVTENELIELLKNKDQIQKELRLGISSEFHANRILQFKGLSYDKKNFLIQEKIGSLIQSRSKDFGKNILSLMQQFLVNCTDEFKVQRDYHHLSRIISVLYIMRQVLAEKTQKFPNNRHVLLKFFKTKIFLENGEKEVLGLLVGLNFLKEHELFEKPHLMKAINVFIKDVIEVKSSFFVDKSCNGSIQTLYLEVEKQNADFTSDEIRRMKNELSEEIKAHVEHLMHRVFMPRNEEEIVRNILILSRELKFVHDLPQLIINFDEQVGDDLAFIVVMLRVLKPKSCSLQEQFNKNETPLRFILEKTKRVGIIRRKYLKEANVFKVLILGKNYIRKDHSLDLNKARLDILLNLNKIFGEIRDYNGGMIHKQNEMLLNLKSVLLNKLDESLLEKYFYNIRPVESSVITPLHSLKSLFLMLLNGIKREETRIKKHCDYLFKKEMRAVYVIIPVYDFVKKKNIKDTICKYYLLSSDFISFDIQVNEIFYLGYIFNTEDEQRQNSFLKVIQQALHSEIF